MNELTAKPVRLLRHLDELTDALRGGLIAIGNFDGVHLGHQAVIAKAREKAEAMNCPLGVMLFDPHPRQFFAPDSPPFRLTRLTTRARLLADKGVDFILALPFDAAMASCSAENFIDNILAASLNIRGVAIGHDFRFGKDRRGDVDMLEAFAPKHNFEVIRTLAENQPDSDTPYSSSAVRAALRDGAPQIAAALLGHHWSIEGIVAQGDQRGRTIGFATANMALDDYLQPKFGVYAVRAEIQDGALAGQVFDGVANLGLRPTVGTDAPRLETHLFDFADDVYGCTLDVALMHFIRPEQKFDGLDALKQQISKDSQQAREMLAADNADC